MRILAIVLFSASMALAEPTTRPVHGPAPKEKPAEQSWSVVAHLDKPAYVPRFAQSHETPALQESRSYAQQFDYPVDPRVAFDPMMRWASDCCRRMTWW